MTVFVGALIAVVLVSRPESGEPLDVQTGSRPELAEPIPPDSSTTTAGPASTTTLTVTTGPASTSSTTSTTRRVTTSTRPPGTTTTVTTATPPVPPVVLIDPVSPPPPYSYPTTTTTLDPKAPRPVGMTVRPREVDTSAGPAKLTIRIEVSAPLGNMADSGLGVQFANGEQIRGLPGNAWDTGWARVSGDDYRATFESVLTLYQHSAHGQWKPAYISTRGTSGRFIEWRDLPASDFDGFTQTGPGDSEPPTVTSLSFTRVPDQDSNGQIQILIKTQLSDPIAGISKTIEAGRWGTSIEIFSPSGKVAYANLAYPNPGTGPPERVDFETVLNLGANPETGVWKLRWVQVADLVGNQRYVPPPDIAAAGFPTSFTIG